MTRWLCLALATTVSPVAADHPSVAPHGGTDVETDARIAFYEQRAADDPLDFMSRNRLGFEYLQRAREAGHTEDYDAAERRFQESLAILAADNDAAVDGVIRVHLARHRFAAALALARSELARRPHALELQAHIGDAWLELGDLDAAESAYRALAAHKPTLAAWARLSRVAEERGRHDEAVALMIRARDADHGQRAEPAAWVHVELGRMELEQGRIEASRPYFEEALRRLPGYDPALARLAELERRAGNPQRAAMSETRAAE